MVLFLCNAMQTAHNLILTIKPYPMLHHMMPFNIYLRLLDQGITKDQINEFCAIYLNNFTDEQVVFLLAEYLIKEDYLSEMIQKCHDEDSLVSEIAFLLATEYNWSQDTNLFPVCDYNPEELQLLLTMYNKLVTNYPHLPLIDHFYKVVTINPN